MQLRDSHWNSGYCFQSITTAKPQWQAFRNPHILDKNRKAQRTDPKGARGSWSLRSLGPSLTLTGPGEGCGQGTRPGSRSGRCPPFPPFTLSSAILSGGAKKLLKNRNALSSLPGYYIVSHSGRFYSDSFELWSCLYIYLFMYWLLYMLLTYWSLIWILSI